MIYKRSQFIESLEFQEVDSEKESSFEMFMTDDGKELMIVSAFNEDWAYTIPLEEPSDYDRVRFNVMQAALEADTLVEAQTMLTSVLEEGFSAKRIKGETKKQSNIIDIRGFLQ